MPTDPQSLLSQSNCFNCYSGGEWALMELALLAQVASGSGPGTGGGGGSGQIVGYSGANPSTGGLVPQNQNAYAVAVKPGGTTFVWDPVAHIWDDGGVIQAITVFDEDVEWTFSGGGSMQGNSNIAPHTGVINIYANHAAGNDVIRLTSPADVTLSNYSSLSFWINPVTSWNATTDLQLKWQKTGSVNVGNPVSIVGAYGFDYTNPSYQNLVIPVADFLVPAGTLVNILQLTCRGSGFRFFYLDTVTLVP